MLRILINSYTCCPGMGSEQGMGWNWITSLAKTGKVELYVISEGEYASKVLETLESEKRKEKSEKSACDDYSWAERILFYWNPVDQSTREKCWNQGNWSFYPLYEKWQKKAAEIARNIIKELEAKGERIDILHQLNMIGFREPGYLAEVSEETGIPLVWGPIGGLKMFPLAYAKDGGMKMLSFNWLKNTITKWQIKHHTRVVKTLRQSSALVSSIPDSYNAIKKYHGLESMVIPETGCSLASLEVKSEKRRVKSDNSPLEILWVGKFDFRKRLDIALKTIALLKEKDVVLKVFGTGNEQQVADAQQLVRSLSIEDKVQFMGARSNDKVTEAMRNADVFFFTSVSEDTSTVVLEAVSNGLPVVCFDCCGMAAVIDEKVGKKVALTNPGQSVKDFASVISKLYNNRETLATMSANCAQRAEELSWENKAKKVVDIYKRLTVKG